MENIKAAHITRVIYAVNVKMETLKNHGLLRVQFVHFVKDTIGYLLLFTCYLKSVTLVEYMQITSKF